MTLTPSYIQSQRFRLGDHANKTLEEIGDDELTARTLIYSNLCEVGRKNLNFKSGVIAQLVADILDARAWEDYVEVDGSRKSCESFSVWLEQNGVDIKLAEYAIKEKKRSHLPAFVTACRGELLPVGKAKVSDQERGEGGRFTASTEPRTRRTHRRKESERWLQKLEQLATTDTYYAGLLEEHVQGRSISSIAIEIGWREGSHSPTKVAKDLATQLGINWKTDLPCPPIDYFTCLHAYAQSHPEILSDLIS